MQTPKAREEVSAELKSDSPLNRARRVFPLYSASIDQAAQRHPPLGLIDWRRMEFEAVAAIIKAYQEG